MGDRRNNGVCSTAVVSAAGAVTAASPAAGAVSGDVTAVAPASAAVTPAAAAAAAVAERAAAAVAAAEAAAAAAAAASGDPIVVRRRCRRREDMSPHEIARLDRRRELDRINSAKALNKMSPAEREQRRLLLNEKARLRRLDPVVRAK